MGMMQYNNPVIRLMVKAANMMIVSFYWVVCCLPVLTILPACAALYHSVAGVVMGRGTGVTKDFFAAFRDALRPGVSLTAVLGVLAALVSIIAYFLGKILFNSGYFHPLIFQDLLLPFLHFLIASYLLLYILSTIFYIKSYIFSILSCHIMIKSFSGGLVL